MNGIDTENLFISMKLSIERIKEKIISKNITLRKNELKSKIKKEQIEYLKTTTIFPKNNQDWVYSKFSTYLNNFNTECPKISKEKELNFITPEQNQKSDIDITNYIYQLNQSINYYKLNNIINAKIELKEESKFWIFLHCDDKSYNNKTAVIIIAREYYNRNFISLGTFIEKNEINKNNNNNKNNFNILSDDKTYEFIEFRKQELIVEEDIKEKKEKQKKLSEEINIKENDEDIFEEKSIYEINIIDDGDKIECKIKLNNGEYINEIYGDFFFPVFENINENNNNENELDNIINLNVKEKESLNSNSGYKIRIAGSGEKCTVIYFENELNLKNQKFEFHNRENDCQCCEIF